jgi:hypothetical protein
MKLTTPHVYWWAMSTTCTVGEHMGSHSRNLSRNSDQENNRSFCLMPRVYLVDADKLLIAIYMYIALGCLDG